MKTSELLRAARKRLDEQLLELRARNEARREEAKRTKRPAELEVADLRALVEESLYSAAGGFPGVLVVEEAKQALERITSPLWTEYVAAFDALPGGMAEVTPEQWAKLRSLGLQAQRDMSLNDWLAAPARRLEEVQSVFNRAFARAVKEERENG